MNDGTRYMMGLDEAQLGIEIVIYRITYGCSLQICIGS